MDENEILSRLDARGRAAAGGVHDALADAPVPLFDPEVHPVTFDGSPRRWARFRWMSAAGIVVLALAAAAVFVVGGDDGDPADRVGTVEPPRRFAAGHLPEGFEVTGVSEASTSSSESELSGPLVFFGPDPSRPELAVAVIREGEEDSEDELEGDVVTVGDRRLVLVSSAGSAISGQAGSVDVDGRQVMVLGGTRAVIEAVAADVEIGAGDRPVVDPSALPDGWEELGQLAGMGEAYGAIASARGRAEGEAWSAFYTEDGETMLTVSSTAGGPLDVGVDRLLSGGSEDVEVRGRPAVLSHTDYRQGEDADNPWVYDTWSVAWEERPGEVVRVSGFGVGRDDVLAVAEGVRPVDADEWAELERAALRWSLRSSEGSVELGEGTFSDGSPWLAYVEDVPYSPIGGVEEGTGTVGGPIPSDAELEEPDAHMVVRTTVSSSTGVGASMAGGMPGTDPAPFLDGVSVEGGGGAFAWAYGLLASEVATVELVDPDGQLLLTVEVLAAGGHRGFLMEIPSDLAEIPGLDGPASGGPSTSALPAPTSTDLPSVAPPTTAEGRSTDDLARAVLVARAADGTELGRQPLP